MIIISILAALLGLVFLYFYLKSSIDSYKSKKRSSLIEKIEATEKEINSLKVLMEKNKVLLKGAVLQKELTIENIKIMEENNLRFLKEKEEKMGEWNKRLIEEEKKEIKKERLNKICENILKTISEKESKENNLGEIINRFLKEKK